MDLLRLRFSGEETPKVSVSLERSPRQCNLHTGILHRSKKGELRQLHFAWHKRLRNDKLVNTVVCAIPEISIDAHLNWLAVFCGLVASNVARNNIPYNLKHDPDVEFDKDTGVFKCGPESTGLNCANFVLAVFRSAGFPLVDPADWPPASDEDKAMQTAFVDQLAASSDVDSQNQAKKIRAEIGTPRIRPDHVAGACLELESGRPAKYSTCESNATVVTGKLDQFLSRLRSL